MKNHGHALIVALVLGLSANVALAHGWIAPPYQPAGMAQQEYQGPTGEGQAPEVEPVTGSTPAPTEPTAPTGRTTPLRVPTGTTAPAGAPVAGRTTPRARGKARTQSWNTELTVPWQAAFPARAERQGYDGELLGIDQALTLGLENGGWARESTRPSVVVIYDATRDDHRRAVERLGQDSRFVAGANLFNCYRVDARLLGESPSDVRLRTYDKAGRFVTEARGTRKVRDAYDALEKAWDTADATPLAKVLPKANALLVECARVAHAIKTYEGSVVCPDCGEERHDVRRSLVQLKAHEATFKKALESLD